MDILIIEDDARLGMSLAKGLKEAGFTVQLASTLAVGRALLRKEEVRLVVLDLGLPDGDGVDLVEECRRVDSPVPIVVTTARGELEARIRGLDAGADDYLVKPVAFAELLARIRAQLRRLNKAAAPCCRIGDLDLNLRTRTATRGGRAIELTPREFDLLAYLMEHGGQVVSREMLARDVWRVRARITSLDNVIDVHISRLREKIDHGTAPLLHTVRGVGFSLREEP
jgi:two-component system copper resistance phosphate regulon response regulator CusR